MTEKQKIFADEYLTCLNASEAYRRVYASDPNAKDVNRAASRLLCNKEIIEYIDKRIKDRTKRTEITQDFVIKEIYDIASAVITDYVNIVEEDKVDCNGKVIVDSITNEPKKVKALEVETTDKLSNSQAKSIASIKKTKFGIEVVLHDKLKALELLGKHLGMFDNKDTTGKEQEKDVANALRELITEIKK